MGSSILPRRPNSTLFPNQGPNRSRRRNGSPPSQRGNRQDGSGENRVPANKLVTGQVKILKRGEPLTVFLGSNAADSGDLDLGLGSTRRLGPDPVPVMIRKKVHFSDEYAGSTVFLQSPPPSSVPVPCFLRKSGGC